MKTKEIELTEILVSETNSRKKCDEAGLKDLTESIKQQGVIEPIVVRPMGDKFEIVCGERRFRACGLAGLKVLPAIVRELDDKQALEVQSIENLQREDLNAIDEAQGFSVMIVKCSCTQEDLSTKLGKSQSYVAARLKLLELPKEIREAIAAGVITPGHGAVLFRVGDEKEQKHMFTKILREKLSVRSAENCLEQYGRSLSAAPFDKKDCLKCVSNGKAQAGLFDKETDLKGRCMNAVCFVKKMDSFINKRKTELEKAGFKVIKEPKNYTPHVNLTDKNYSGKEKKSDLGKQYEGKCSGCDKRCYVFTEGGTYGQQKGIRSIDEWCLNPRCFTTLTTPKRSRDNGSLPDTDNKDRLNQRLADQAREAKQRFWKEKLKDQDSKQMIAAVSLFLLVNDYGFMNSEVDINSILPKAAIEKNCDNPTVELIYKLGIKEIEKATQKAFEVKIQNNIDDEDLEFLCGVAGFSVAKDYVIDEAYLQPKTKEQLVALAKEIGIGKIDPDLKKPEIIATILKADLKGKVPKDMKK